MRTAKDFGKDRVGQKVFSKKYNQFIELIDWKNSLNVTVKLDDGREGIESYQAFKFGYFPVKPATDDFWKQRIGETNYTKTVGRKTQLMTIVDYIKEPGKTTKIKILFDDNTEVIDTYRNFKNGLVRNKNVESVYNSGKTNFIINRRDDRAAYKCWAGMLRQCKNSDLYDLNTLENAYCCEEWLDFKNFKEWYDKNYYKIDGLKVAISKVIFNKNNTLYSPENCCFLPRKLMTIVTTGKEGRKINKTNDLPVGVGYNEYHEGTKRWISKTSPYEMRFKDIRVACKTVEEAFNLYKELKEEHVKNLALQYKNYLTEKVFNALMNYTVEITD